MQAVPLKKKSNNIRNFLFLLVVLIGSYIFIHKYLEHKKYENISRFDKLPNDSIDVNFYDPSIVKMYFKNCKQLTDLAKTLWLKNGIDVAKDKTGFGEAESKLNSYNALLRITQPMEIHLKESRELKEQGLSNEEISEILNKGITIGAYQIEKDKQAAFEFLKGKNVNRASSADQVWEMQKLLNANEYNIAIDGIFNSNTDSALVDYQTKNNLFPSHTCNDVTLIHLVK